ncbi:urea ABC transporter permease subunit UrtB [Paenibacillus glucanolyticus]|jgi:urea transport system permease protein|uniref:urea ABC transporter permease subunit UrtB n=1 Tax=Paenibacillus TaxID=44249 RepID=UPI0003E29EAB|nr:MULTISPECIES: urea ABC transporter permease subunit UrtB [Paenibacillus]ANA81513.1 urea ABC transporter permease subunit UrtB [Paenibacillus glucanolyticus]AVV59756.1 urea ABC transporter permease subunit UrtB [Paenibacillus glucanolyticus]AWP29008.1 branched-chain amino acid ABC transporter permease [Paenibacillus sp. Cedars]ETT33457.1 urea ABC transporter permease UrtB [Paenibacillus sp. FSL R5-808]MPY19443.1 urea ABC transporter permease subunit UrtB [Paenibacillus glucanolyticus]
MEMTILQVFNGLSVSSILLLIALGLAVTFGLMNVINMAHGELIMIGAYSTYVTQGLFTAYMPKSWFDTYFIAALLVSFVVAALIGWLLEMILIRHLYGRPLDSLLATWGVGMMLQQIARFIFGAPNVAVTSPSWLNGGLAITSSIVLPYKRLFIIVLVALVLTAMYLYIYRTVQGRRMRAVMQNRNMAGCLGISTRRVDGLTFAIGSGIAGIAGCALTLLGPIGPSIGTYYIVDAFMVVVLGGVGKLIGTVAGALGIGMFNTLFETYTSASIGKVLVFALIVAFLQWKPRGLVALRTRSLD